jgi:hypothetical protein
MLKSSEQAAEFPGRSAWTESQWHRSGITWAGYGSGSDCFWCNEPIPSDAVEYEWRPAGDALGTSFRFHISCFRLWYRAQSRASESEWT